MRSTRNKMGLTTFQQCIYTSQLLRNLTRIYQMQPSICQLNFGTKMLGKHYLLYFHPGQSQDLHLTLLHIQIPGLALLLVFSGLEESTLRLILKYNYIVASYEGKFEHIGHILVSPFLKYIEHICLMFPLYTEMCWKHPQKY